MDPIQFSRLIQDIKSCTFASSKRKCISKIQGVTVNAQQVYTLVGQFTSSSDRRDVVNDLHKDKKLLPMTGAHAAPIVSMGIYSGAQRNILDTLSGYIVDRQDPMARNAVKKVFESHSDRQWAEKLLVKLGPFVYQQTTYPGGQYPGAASAQYPPQQPPAAQYPPQQSPSVQYPPQQPPAVQYPPQQSPAVQYPSQQPPAGAYMPNQPPAGQYLPQPPAAGYMPQQPPAGGYIPQQSPAGGYMPQQPHMGQPYPQNPPLATCPSAYPPPAEMQGGEGDYCSAPLPAASAPIYPDLPQQSGDYPHSHPGQAPYPGQTPYPGQAPPPYAEKA